MAGTTAYGKTGLAGPALALMALAAAFAAPPALLAADNPVRAGKAAAKPGAKPAPKAPAKAAPKQAKPPVQIPPTELAMPKVVLSDTHAKTCLVKVGDTLPEIALKDLAGKPQNLAALADKHLSVVVFWDGKNPYALEELADLEPDVVKRLGEKEVKVIAINERDSAAKVAAVVKRLGISYPVLLDADGKALAQVASQRLPRTYLVDGGGKILWFDTEYSATTRRDLRDAIRVARSPDFAVEVAR